MTSTISPRRATAAVIVALALSASCRSGSPGSTEPIGGQPRTIRQAKWGLAWSDEFNGTTLDGSKWIAVYGPANVNNELEYYTPSEAYLENGSLVLRSQQRDTAGRRYTSAEVRSGTKAIVTVGSAVEWRTQIPAGKGIWPANWLVNTTCDGLGGCGGAWPPEIDVMEIKGSAPATNYMTHWWGTWPNQHNLTSTFTAAQSLADGFHTYRVEWYADSIFWFVDGTRQAAHTQNITTGQLQVVMNTAVGGDFDGSPDGTTVFPQYHRIDYVRVYRDTANVY